MFYVDHEHVKEELGWSERRAGYALKAYTELCDLLGRLERSEMPVKYIREVGWDNEKSEFYIAMAGARIECSYGCIRVCNTVLQRQFGVPVSAHITARFIAYQNPRYLDDAVDYVWNIFKMELEIAG